MSHDKITTDILELRGRLDFRVLGLREFRESNQITRGDFAARLQVSKNSIEKIEVGQRGLSPRVLARISEAFEVGPDELHRLGLERAQREYARLSSLLAEIEDMIKDATTIET